MSTTSPNPPVVRTTDYFGPMVSLADVEDAVLGALQSPTQGLPFYVAETERKHSLDPRTLPLPPSPVSYRGGLDFETFEQDVAPVVIAVVAPVGDLERYGGGEYGSWFEVQVGCITTSEDSQDEARRLAQFYGSAVALCVIQQGSLGGLANDTRLQAFPRVSFPDPTRRSLAMSTTVFRIQVQPVFMDSMGPYPPYIDPLEPGDHPDPYDLPGMYPVVKVADSEVIAVPITEDVDSVLPDDQTPPS